MAHNHNHNHAHHHESGGNIGIAFFLNLSFTIIELIGGLLTNSVAIMSDAVHDFGYSLSLGLAWYFQRLSGKGSTKRYTYGYKRFSLLGAITNSAVLLAGSVFIVAQAIPRLLKPQETNATGMLALAVIGVLVNGAAAFRTSKASSINERTVSLHLLEDVLGWAAVLIGSLVMRFTGLTDIDPILSVAIACFVLVNVFKNIRQVLPILLQGVPPDIDSAHIAEILNGIDSISGVHDLHIWSLDEEYNVLTVHAVLKEALPAEALVALKCDIRALLKEQGVQHATIEFETPGEDCGFKGCC
jgi:cobalt-zinc-cadmium efflux system protein